MPMSMKDPVTMASYIPALVRLTYALSAPIIQNV